MKVVQIVNSLDCGGQEMMIISLARDLMSRGHKCRVVTVAHQGELASQAEINGIKIDSLCEEKGFSLIALLRLSKLLRTDRPDVIHIHNHRPLVYGGISSRFLGIPSIFTRHGSGRLMASKWLWNSVDKLVAISGQAARDMKAQNPYLENREVNVIPNGIDLSVYTASTSSIAGKRIGVVARLAPEKDIATLIEAFRTIQRVLPEAELLVAGDGPERAKLEDLAAGTSTTFLGMRDDIPELMRSFRVFSLSSLTEGVSLTLLEAMAASRPVVATNVGGNPEVVIDGETGFLVPSKDPQAMAEKILELLRNPALAERMGKAGRKCVEERFSLERMVDDYEMVYREVLEKLNS